MHTGAHLAIAYLAFSWAEPTSLAAALVGSVLPDVQFLPVQIDAALTRTDFHHALGKWRNNKLFRCLDFSLQSPLLSFSAFLVSFLLHNTLPDWVMFFTFNWFLHMVEDILTHKTSDLQKVEPAWPMAWPFFSRVVGFGLVSDHDSRFLPKIEIALMALAAMVFVLRTFG